MIKNKFSYEITDKDITERDFAEEELELETVIFRRFRLAYESSSGLNILFISVPGTSNL